MKKRVSAMKDEMAAESGVERQRWVGGDWDELAEDVFTKAKGGYTFVNFIRFAQKYVITTLF